MATETPRNSHHKKRQDSMASDGNVHEEMFNYALSEALLEATARWREDPSLVKPEHSGVFLSPDHKKRPDILIVDSRSPPLVIECSYDPKDADNDAIDKLGVIVKKSRREVKTCIALHVPKEFKTKKATKDDLIADGAKIRFAVHQKTDGEPRRWPKAGFVDGDVWSLATLILSVSLPKEDIESVAEKVAALVDDAAGVLEALPEAAKRKIDRRINQGSMLKSLKTTMVLWLNALLTQQRLQSQNVQGIPPLDFSRESLPSHSNQVKVWRKIQKVNWRAIFVPAIKILKIAGNARPHAAGEALRHLVNAVDEIENAGLGLHINVGAELFPKLSEDRKQAAAFYTQAATAELLATLTIRKDDLSEDEWKDSELFSKRCVADLACGTGTLLRAGYRRVQSLHEASVRGGGNARRHGDPAPEGNGNGVDRHGCKSDSRASDICILSGDWYGRALRRHPNRMAERRGAY